VAEAKARRGILKPATFVVENPWIRKRRQAETSDEIRFTPRRKRSQLRVEGTAASRRLQHALLT
jgi:hypothetical protein